MEFVRKEFIEQYDKVEDQNEIEVFLAGKKDPRIPCEISVSQFEIDEVSDCYKVVIKDFFVIPHGEF